MSFEYSTGQPLIGEMEKSLKENIKPPLGLKPLKHWENGKNIDRIGDILNAMTRYSEQDKVIPLDWISELYGRISNLGEK